MKKTYFTIVLLCLICTEYALSLTSTTLTTASLSSNVVFTVKSFTTFPSTLTGNGSILFYANFTNTGDIPGIFNLSIWIPDTSELLNISTNTTLLSGETVEALKIYSSTLSVGTHSTYLYINSTNTSVSVKYDLVINAQSSGTTTSTSGSGGNSGGGGGSIGINGPTDQETKQIETNINEINSSVQALNVYTEATPELGFSIAYQLNNNTNDSSIDVKGIPYNWKYTLTRKKNILIINIKTDDSQYGTYPIELNVNGSTATSIVKLVPTKPLDILRSYNVNQNKQILEVQLTIKNNEQKSRIMNIVETIPKHFAQTADEINFSIKPKIIVNDPQVQWQLYLKSNNSIKIAYTTKNKLKSIDYSIFSSFISQGEVITSDLLGTITTSIYTPDVMYPGKTRNATITIENIGITSVNVTILVKLPSECTIESDYIIGMFEPRSVSSLNLPITCSEKAQPGNYIGTFTIKIDDTSKNYDFNFKLYQNVNQINNESNSTLIIIIILFAVITFITIIFGRTLRKGYSKLWRKIK